jgi:hypothetical protein
MTSAPEDLDERKGKTSSGHPGRSIKIGEGDIHKLENSLQKGY